MTSTPAATQPARLRHPETLQRISPRPAELRPGDVLRDCGANRVVARVETSPGLGTVTVHFDADPEHPEWPPHLGVPAHQAVTAWRGAEGAR